MNAKANGEMTRSGLGEEGQYLNSGLALRAEIKVGGLRFISKYGFAISQS